MTISRSGRIGALAMIAALAIGALAVAPAATAATPAAIAGPAWLRLGHFSPDTKQVDVRITSLKGGDPALELSSVGYGDVSTYKPLPEGSYTVAMVAAGSGDWENLAISATVTLTSDKATTVAAYGPSSKLQVRAFQDDLTTPTDGKARIRVVQASTITPTVDVKTSTGVPIASGAKTGSATTYAEVPAGPWTLDLTGQGVSNRADVNVAAGSVTSLFVLDTADGKLAIVPVLDSAAVPLTPVGGVQTGGGYLASAGAGHQAVTVPRASLQ